MALTNITERTNPDQPRWLTVLRVLLGLILFWKGIIFIRDTALLRSLIGQTGIETFSRSDSTLALIVSILSLLCGLFITVGLFTRASSIVQLPIIIIAVFFVNIKNLETNAFELVLSIIVLILLVLFIIKGSGALSADEYFRTYYQAGAKEGKTKNLFQ